MGFNFFTLIKDIDFIKLNDRPIKPRMAQTYLTTYMSDQKFVIFEIKFFPVIRVIVNKIEIISSFNIFIDYNCRDI